MTRGHLGPSCTSPHPALWISYGVGHFLLLPGWLVEEPVQESREEAEVNPNHASLKASLEQCLPGRQAAAQGPDRWRGGQAGPEVAMGSNFSDMFKLEPRMLSAAISEPPAPRGGIS